MRRCDLRSDRREVALRERAAGAGFEVALEARRGPFIWELHCHDDRPRSVVNRVAARPSIVPIESIVDVRCAAHVVPRRVGFAPQNVNESRSDSTHADRVRTSDAA